MSLAAGPYHVLAKPAGAACNIDCTYCFFLSKDNLYEDKKPRMTPELLEQYIQRRLDNHEREVEIAWQGGEPTLMGLDFYRLAMELVARHKRPRQQVRHTIQTNGVALNDEWCRFFKQHNFLVGLSMDGPQALHDAYRVDKGGRGTYALVERAWWLLCKHEVETNILCCVHRANMEQPLEVYRHFRDTLGARHLQFIPIVERVTPQLLPVAEIGWGKRRPIYLQQGDLVTSRSVRAEPFGQFLSAIFDEWVSRDVGQVFVQTFDAALGNWLGMHSMCIFSPTCGSSLAMEHNGDVYACDHYVEPGYKIGNVAEDTFEAMLDAEAQQAFGQDKLDKLPQYCRQCEVLFACYGECPRNRFINTPDGEPGLNYLCAGYRQFFNHIDAPMTRMTQLLAKGQNAEDIMAAA
ncbi:anaerobic sulfatase maturase [Methylobacillus methanolivorans]